MDWKEKAKEILLDTGIVGVSGYFGHLFLKYGKQSVSPIRKIFKNVDKVEALEVQGHYLSELVKSVIHFSPYPMWIMAMDGNMEFANHEWCQLTGFGDPDEAYEWGFMRAVPDRDLAMMQRRNDDFVRRPNNDEGEITLRHVGTGLEFKAHFKTKLIYGFDKKPYKCLGILTNIRN